MTRSSLFLWVSVTLAVAPLCSSQESDDELRARAARLHQSAIVVDTHTDLTPFIMKDTKPAEITDSGMAGNANFPKDDLLHAPIRSPWMRGFPPGAWSFAERHADGYMDLPRIRQGGLDAEFFAIYMEREPRPGMAVKRALAQIESVHALCEKYPDDIALATTADEVRAIAASGRVAALMGLEGGHMSRTTLESCACSTGWVCVTWHPHTPSTSIGPTPPGPDGPFPNDMAGSVLSVWK